LSSPNTALVAADGEGSQNFDHADLQYVGVSTDYSALRKADGASNALSDSTIFFGIATHGVWSTPNEVEFDIFIDTDEDGQADYKLFNSDRVGFQPSSTQVSDAFVTVLEDLKTGGFTSQEFLNFYSAHARSTAIYNSNVMVLPIEAAALGLGANNTDFDYYVESYSHDLSSSGITAPPVERTRWFAYDITRPGLDVAGGASGAPIYDDLDGAVVEIGYTVADYQRANARGLLIFHHHNVSDRRAEVVPVISQWPYRLFAPFIIK
ncbi:MAG: hypothetical protein HC802_10560, partial [Caldilineaceae bacterium]|nr:hypothetical protein [Caldilineaceae bacterium]